MKSPFEKRLDYHLASSGVKDELDRLAKATPSNEAAEKFGMELAAKGLPRLDDATLLMRARVLSLVLAKLDDKTCASMARGTLNVDVLQRLLEAVQSLDPQSLDQWAQGSVAAMAAEIRQTPVQGLTMKQQEMAIDAIVTACGPDGSRVSEISSRIKTASDADASYLIRKLYTTVVTMPEPTRSMALRALVSEPNQNQ